MTEHQAVSSQAAASAPAAAHSGPHIAHSRLDNGMEVVVIPDHRAPVVTHMVWYRNGSADDPPLKSGIAHFLEHLMFKGTKNHPQGEFSQLVADLGGQENAFTGHDYTSYFQRVPREHLATMMEYEADRMTNLVLSDEVVAPERDVVMEERRMRTDSDPAAELSEAVQAALFAHHPYGTPIIGWGHEIETLGREDALAYYQRFYTPENAILVVAGDVQPADVEKLARDTYGRIPARGAPGSSPSSRTVPKVSTTLQSKPPIGNGAPNTPSPSSCAAAMPFGPAAAITIGTSIGRGGAKPSGCIICITPPSHSTCSPRSSARSAVT